MQEDGTNLEDTARLGVKHILAFVLVFIAMSTAILSFMLRGDDTANMTIKPETSRQIYLNILGETHTGLRLVRLQNYAKNNDQSENITATITARDALAGHEQKAWAVLTHSLHSLKTTPVQKTKALSTYKTTWGIWSRQQDLPNLLQATVGADKSPVNMQYAPNARRSKFAARQAKDTDETNLAGAIHTATYQPNAIIQPHMPSAYKVREPRIKYAKRPHYPRRARRKSIEAVVTLALDIDARGNVARTHVVSIHTSRYENKFIRSARRAAMASKFHPKTIGGNSVASSGNLRKYTFDSGG